MFLEYLAPVMDDLDHPALIEKWKQNLDATDYETNLYKNVKLPSIKKQIGSNDKTKYYCPTSKNESINFLPFL